MNATNEERTVVWNTRHTLDSLGELMEQQCRQLDELTDLLKQYLEQQERHLESLKNE